VQLSGPGARSLVGHIAGDGGAVAGVGERVAVLLVNAPSSSEQAELVGGAQVGQAREREAAGTRGPGGGGVEEQEAEVIEVAGGRRGVDGDVVERARVGEARPSTGRQSGSWRKWARRRRGGRRAEREGPTAASEYMCL
jgi:hypothetical protein